MRKHNIMKKGLLLGLTLICLTVNAKSSKDSIIMTIGGRPVEMKEFIFMAEKNSEVDLKDQKSLKNYIELFENFKLKVAAAQDAGIDKTKSFKDELDGYRNQLVNSYLSDRNGEAEALKEVYDRYGTVLEVEHILFRLPKQSTSRDTLQVYKQVQDAYKRIKSGESLSKVGEDLMQTSSDNVKYEYIGSLLPMQVNKAFENAVYSMKVGEVGMPLRTTLGFHIVKLISKRLNPGEVKVAHILISTESGDDNALSKADSIYDLAMGGADFSELAKNYSADKGSAQQGGELPFFGVGELVEPFEKSAFSLRNKGDISEPVKSVYGYHIIKLIDKKGIASFEEKSKIWSGIMARGERNFEYYEAFDNRMMKEYGYKANSDAYHELEKLCDDNYPTNPAFYENAEDMNKILFHINNKDYTQKDFLAYMRSHPYSKKSYAGDFMYDVYRLYIRDIFTEAERVAIPFKYSEFALLMNEYKEGMLLFEISNREIWNKPSTQQESLEKEWIRRLRDTYPINVNWKLLKKINK